MVATLDDVPFDVDPHSVTWDYEIHVADKPFLGGKVIQVYGASIGNITVTGKFGGGDLLTKQLDFLERMKTIGRQRLNNVTLPPSRFQWPEQGWDMSVMLRSVQQIVHAPEVFAPDWEIVLFPIEGSDSLKSAAITSFVERLSAGMGWSPGAFNGGTITGINQLFNSAGVTTVTEYLAKAFGIGTTPTSSGQTQ